MPKDDRRHDLTEEEIDMLLEEIHGKPVDKGSLAANIAALERRIAALEKERTKFESAPAKGRAHTLLLQANTRNLQKAHDLLAFYRAERGTKK